VAAPAERISDKIRSPINDDFPRLDSASFILPATTSELGFGGIAVVGEGTGMSVYDELQEFRNISLLAGEEREEEEDTVSEPLHSCQCQNFIVSMPEGAIYCHAGFGYRCQFRNKVV